MKTPGHAMEVLRLVASSDASDAALRQAGAVRFKNLVKKGWDESKDVSVLKHPVGIYATDFISPQC